MLRLNSVTALVMLTYMLGPVLSLVQASEQGEWFSHGELSDIETEIGELQNQIQRMISHEPLFNQSAGAGKPEQEVHLDFEDLASEFEEDFALKPEQLFVSAAIYKQRLPIKAGRNQKNAGASMQELLAAKLMFGAGIEAQSSLEVPTADVQLALHNRQQQRFHDANLRSAIDEALLTQIYEDTPSGKLHSYSDAAHVTSATRGILQTKYVIEEFEAGDLSSFFHERAKIEPMQLAFGEVELFIPKLKTITVSNPSKTDVLELTEIKSLSPRFLMFLQPQGYTEPEGEGEDGQRGYSRSRSSYLIQPGGSLVLRLILIPDIIGKQESGLLFNFNQDEAYLVYVTNAMVIENKFLVEHQLVFNSALNSTVEIHIHLRNHQETTLYVTDLYTSAAKLKLFWPNKSPVLSFKQDPEQRKYLQVQKRDRAWLCSVRMNATEAGEHSGFVRMRLTHEHKHPESGVQAHNYILRIPVHFFVTERQLFFQPYEVDFGMVPLGFENLCIKVVMINHGRRQMRILGAYLPVQDPRLEFVPLLREPGVLSPGAETRIADVFLSPSEIGLVDQQIVVYAVDSFERTHQYVLPIRADIRKKTVTAGIIQQEMSFDVAQFMRNETTHWWNEKSNAQSQLPKGTPVNKIQFRPDTLVRQLQFTNHLDQPLLVSRVVTHNHELTLRPERALLLDEDKSFQISAQRTYHYGTLELRTGMLSSPSLEKFIFLQANNTIFPISIGVYDRLLWCIVEDGKLTDGVTYLPCVKIQKLDFQYLVVEDVKIRNIVIFNPNPFAASIESLNVTVVEGLEVNLTLVEMRDKNSGLILHFEPIPIQLGTNKGVAVPPYYKATVQVKMRMVGDSHGTLSAGQRVGQVSTKVDIKFREKNIQGIRFSLVALITPGQLLPVPEVLRFKPEFASVPQQLPLELLSSLSIQVHLGDIFAPDPRFTFERKNNVVQGANGLSTEIFTVKFDPNKVSTTQHVFGSIVPKKEPKGLTHFDLLEWREKLLLWERQESDLMTSSKWVWDRKLNRQLREVRTHLTLTTDFVQNLTIPVIAYEARPEIVLERRISFGETQRGSHRNASITILNPSNEVLRIELLLGPASIANEAGLFPQERRSKKVQAGKVLQKEDPRPQPPPRELASYAKIEEFTSIINFCKLQIREDYRLFEHKGKVSSEQYQTHKQEESLKRRKNLKLEFQIFDDFQDPSENLFQGNSQVFLSEKTDYALLCSLLYQVHKRNISYEDLAKSFLKDREDNNLTRLYLDEFIAMRHSEFKRSNSFQQMIPQNFGKSNNLTQIIQESQSNQELSSSQRQNNEAQGWNNPFRAVKIMKGMDQDIVINQNLYKNTNLQIKKIDSAISKDQVLLQGAEVEAQQIRRMSELKLKELENVQMQRLLQRKSKSPETSAASFSLYYQGFIKILKKVAKDAKSQFGTFSPEEKLEKVKREKFYQAVDQNGRARRPYIYSEIHEEVFMQSFFINPQYIGAQFKVEPRLNITLQDAVFFSPHNLDISNMQSATLIVKNNLTIIEPILLTGSPGSGLLEIQKVLRESPDGLMETETLFEKNFRNVTSLNDIFSFAQVKDHEPVVFRFSKKDLLYQDANGETKVRSHHKRALALKNRGNLPVYVTAVTVEDQSCSSNGFTVETCRNFQVAPGDTFYMHVSFETDGVLGEQTRIMRIHSDRFTQTFLLSVQINFKDLIEVQQLYSFGIMEHSTRHVQKFMVLLIALSAFAYLSLISLQILKRANDKRQQKVKINKEEPEKKSPYNQNLVFESVFKAHAQIQEKFEKGEVVFKEANNLWQKKTSSILSQHSQKKLLAQQQAALAAQQAREQQLLEQKRQKEQQLKEQQDALLKQEAPLLTPPPAQKPAPKVTEIVGHRRRERHSKEEEAKEDQKEEAKEEAKEETPVTKQEFSREPSSHNLSSIFNQSQDEEMKETQQRLEEVATWTPVKDEEKVAAADSKRTPKSEESTSNLQAQRSGSRSSHSRQPEDQLPQKRNFTKKEEAFRGRHPTAPRGRPIGRGGFQQREYVAPQPKRAIFQKKVQRPVERPEEKPMVSRADSFMDYSALEQEVRQSLAKQAQETFAPPPGLGSGTFNLTRKDFAGLSSDPPPGLVPEEETKQDFFSAFQQSSSLFTMPLFQAPTSENFGGLFEREPKPQAQIFKLELGRKLSTLQTSEYKITGGRQFTDDSDEDSGRALEELRQGSRAFTQSQGSRSEGRLYEEDESSDYSR